MDPTGVLLVWLGVGLIAAIASAMVGSTKDRTVEGFFLGLFFSVFGLMAVAAMPPSDSLRRESHRELARLVAEMLAVGPASIGEDARICPFCAEMILAEAVVCRYCGRDLPELVTDAAQNTEVGDDLEPDDPGVTVSLQGCEGAVGPTCRLNLRVEPGYVLVDARREDCDNAGHVLILTAEEAVEACERIRIAASHGVLPSDTSGRQKAELTVDWSIDEDDGAASVSFDWTSLFLDSGALARWDAGDRPDEADCGTLYLWGDVDMPGTEVESFVTALSGCAHVAEEWAAGRVNLGTVRMTLSGFGSLVPD